MEMEHNPTQVWLHLVNSFQRAQNGKGGRTSSFAVEEAHRYRLGQVIKVNSHSDVMYVPLIWYEENGMLPQCFSSEKHVTPV